jgi:hypothetical protein
LSLPNNLFFSMDVLSLLMKHIASPIIFSIYFFFFIISMCVGSLK